MAGGRADGVDQTHERGFHAAQATGAGGGGAVQLHGGGDAFIVGRVEVNLHTASPRDGLPRFQQRAKLAGGVRLGERQERVDVVRPVVLLQVRGDGGEFGPTDAVEAVPLLIQGELLGHLDQVVGFAAAEPFGPRRHRSVIVPALGDQRPNASGASCLRLKSFAARSKEAQLFEPASLLMSLSNRTTAGAGFASFVPMVVSSLPLRSSVRMQHRG